ncbi:DUF7544 domain-containing protein [Halobaculum sp. P14]|uniref:DUF7544 domain-containing protein n=1 Tax=Halobaculum sp. P14 TaxID=3421638 RepID=UPI003EC135AE
MSWHAIDAVDDAIDASKGFLFPFSLGRWARLALLTLLLGGGGVGFQQVFRIPQFVSQYGSETTTSATSLLSGGPAAGFGAAAALPLPSVLGQAPGLHEFLPAAVGILGLVFLALLLLLVVVLVVAVPVLEFVYVDAIRRDEVRILSPFRRFFWKGIRLLLFQLGVTVLFAIPVVVVAGVVLAGYVSVDSLGVGALVALAVVAVLYFLLFVFVNRVTREFVVPAMLVDDSGVIAGWRNVWPLLRGQPKQTVVYVLMHFFVGIGVSIGRGIAALVGLIAVAIVSAVVGLATAAVVGTTDLGVSAGLLAGFGVGVLLYLVFVAAPLSVLAVTYLRTYELATLAGFDDHYDLLTPYREDDDAGDAGEAGSGPGDGDGGSGPSAVADRGASDGAGVGSASDASLGDESVSADESPDGSAPPRDSDEFGDFVPATSDADESGDADTDADESANAESIDDAADESAGADSSGDDEDAT